MENSYYPIQGSSTQKESSRGIYDKSPKSRRFFKSAIIRMVQECINTRNIEEKEVLLSCPGVETATRARQQIWHPYGKPRMGEESN